MGNNILSRLKDNIEEKTSNQLYRSTGGILGRPNKSARPWPQSSVSTKGFLPVEQISPFIGGNDDSVDQSKLSEFKIKDWRGVLLDSHPVSDKFGNKNLSETLDRIELSKNFPLNDNLLNENNPLEFNPYSTRDIYKIFNDSSTDYFKHGIYIDRQNLNNSNGNVFSTPEENNDPVIFGFDLIIDVDTSPLLNGSIIDFISQFSSISEIQSKTKVYNDFKKQFIKIFKTNSNVDIDELGGYILNQTGKSNINKYANSDEIGSISYGKKAYMSYYLQNVSGIKNLSEINGSDSFKYLVDYRKDVIGLSFIEDVSLTMGTLSNLYKLLYWSKPNGKSLIPDNLLRFNCKIIVSELRNFSRVRASNNRVDVIKDNLSRYVYDLKECQFFFGELPHKDTIDNTKTDIYDSYPVTFNYKYSSMVFERFNPIISKYIGYNNGGMWDSNGNQSKYFESDFSTLIGNGIDRDFIIKNYVRSNSEITNTEISDSETENSSTVFQRFKRATIKKGIQAGEIVKENIKVAVRRELQTVVNTQVALLNKSLNKILNAVAGTRGIKPPLNVYNDDDARNGRYRPRPFYDIRGQLADFAGDSISGILGG